MSYLFDELSGKEATKEAVEDKILLMGLQAAGKTAIKDVVFFNKQPDDVDDYMATVHYQRQFIDEEQKSMIIDSGGQESYWNEAVTHFRHLVFSNVKLLVWIIDVTKPELFEESERRFSFTIRQYKKENPEGRITVLCHKVDLVTPEKMVVIHQHLRDMFSDSRYEIDFENTSIYYAESLRELLFTIMAEAGINTKRFELISNLEQKVEESEEFQSYVLEHAEDPRVQQLRDFLNPKPEALLPSFGKLSMQVDLKEYDIVEIVLVDKTTNSPIVGASSQANVNAETSMEYLIALHDFKNTIKEEGENFDPSGTILTSSTGKVHAMIFSLDANYLLITSFNPITEDRKALLYELILRFAQSTSPEAKAAASAPVAPVQKESIAQPIAEPEPIIQAPPIVEPTPIQAGPEISAAKPIKIEEILTKEERAAGFFEPAIIGDEFLGKEESATIPTPESNPQESIEAIQEPEISAQEVVPEPPKVDLESIQEVAIESTEPVASVNTSDSLAINFTAEDIKNFANFLVQKKDTILDESVTVDNIKSMSNFLFKGIVDDKEENKEEGSD